MLMLSVLLRTPMCVLYSLTGARAITWQFHQTVLDLDDVRTVGMSLEQNAIYGNERDCTSGAPERYDLLLGTQKKLARTYA